MKLKSLFCLIIFCAASPALAKDFDSWTDDMKREAIAAGISQSVAEYSLSGLNFLPRVIELDKKQPEKTIDFVKYESNVITQDRIQKGRRLLAENRTVLDKVSTQYGVPPEYIVALWGMETSYGKNTGNFYLLDALATLAYEGRRAKFFKEELLNTLRMVDNRGIMPEKLQGSWAGAMGQCQFMPSSYLRFAVDYNNDGIADIWDTKADVFASIANYLSQSGWNNSYGWGQRVSLPADFNGMHFHEQRKTLAEWQRLGLQLSMNGVQPSAQAMLILIDEDPEQAVLVTGNYEVIMKWNRSRYFATSVGLLANEIGERQ